MSVGPAEPPVRCCCCFTYTACWAAIWFWKFKLKLAHMNAFLVNEIVPANWRCVALSWWWERSIAGRRCSVYCRCTGIGPRFAGCSVAASSWFVARAGSAGRASAVPGVGLISANAKLRSKIEMFRAKQCFKQKQVIIKMFRAKTSYNWNVWRKKNPYFYKQSTNCKL